MSRYAGDDAEPMSGPDGGVVETVIVPGSRDLGGFSVKRVLPAKERQMVGPFVFFDQMGPAVFGAGRGLDVRPHPHIGLSTVTYLFDGEIMHRDSLGTVQAIQPGAVNWMTAGRGIVHSERTAAELRASNAPLHGIQTWVALPVAHENDAELSVLAGLDLVSAVAVLGQGDLGVALSGAPDQLDHVVPGEVAQQLTEGTEAVVRLVEGRDDNGQRSCDGKRFSRQWHGWPQQLPDQRQDCWERCAGCSL